MRRIIKIYTIDGEIFYCSFKNEDEMHAWAEENEVMIFTYTIVYD